MKAYAAFLKTLIWECRSRRSKSNRSPANDNKEAGDETVYAMRRDAALPRLYAGIRGRRWQIRRFRWREDPLHRSWRGRANRIAAWRHIQPGELDRPRSGGQSAKGFPRHCLRCAGYGQE